MGIPTHAWSTNESIIQLKKWASLWVNLSLANICWLVQIARVCFSPLSSQGVENYLLLHILLVLRAWPLWVITPARHRSVFATWVSVCLHRKIKYTSCELQYRYGCGSLNTQKLPKTISGMDQSRCCQTDWLNEKLQKVICAVVRNIRVRTLPCWLCILHN